MAVVQGQRIGLGYNVTGGTADAANERLDISSFLDVLHPTDIPLMKIIGRDSLRDPCEQVKHEWLEDEVLGLSATTTDSDLNNTTVATVALTLTTAAQSTYFRGATNDYDGPFDIVRISSGAGDELARVTAVAAGVVTVERGYASWSTPVDHTGFTKTVTIIGTAQVQGLTSVGESRTTTKTNKFNYTQIFEDTLKASATVQATRKIVSGNELDRQRGYIAEKMGQLFERTLIFGKRLAPAFTSSVNQDPGTMDGIRSVLATNIYAKASAALTQVMLEDAWEAIWQAGGKPSHLIANSTQLRRIDTFIDAYRQAGYDERQLGNFVSRYETRWGVISFVLDRHMPTDEVLILDASKIGFGPLSGRSMAETHIPPTSREADVWEWTGEYTSEVRLEKGHARIYQLATTGLF